MVNPSPKTTLSLTSFGGAKTVTGSKHLLTEKSTNHHILMDCGLFQGIEQFQYSSQERVWPKELPDPCSIDGIFLTHGHLDHCGLLPYLARRNFKGPLYCTRATGAIAEIVLRDAAGLIQQEARKANRHLKKEKLRRKPLYQTIHVEKVLRLFRFIEYDEPFLFGPYEVRFISAGHILGASSLELIHRKSQKKILFSGDLGRGDDPLLPPPTPPQGNHDFIICESTYGDRHHPAGDIHKQRCDELKELICEVKKSSSRLLIAAFSVQRTQMLLYYFHHLFEKNPSLKLPLFFDGPMANRVSESFSQFSDFLKISSSQYENLFSHAQFIKNSWDKKKIPPLSSQRKEADIVVSSSGMLTGGKVLDYFEQIISQEGHILFLPGYQGERTLGRELIEGRKEVQWGGKKYDVKCSIRNSSLFSAHADQRELLQWIKKASKKKAEDTADDTQIFLVHGQRKAQDELKILLEGEGFSHVEELSFSQERELF